MATTTRLTKRAVDALQPTDRDVIYWDASLAGFGVRVQPSGRKVYVIGFRPDGSRQFRRLTIGRHGAITPDAARTLAKRHLGDVARGQNPAEARRARRRQSTVRELGEHYLAYVAERRKANTASKYRRMWERHVLPAIGGQPVAQVTTEHVARLHRRLRATPIMANRVLALIQAFFTYVGKQGIRARHENPAGGIEKYPERGRERFLSPEEFARLADALNRAETGGLPPAPEHRRQRGGKHKPKSSDQPIIADPYAVNAIRLAALSGARIGEVLALRWADVDLERGFLRLGDSKTGRSVRPLGAAARALLASLPREHGNPHCFPGHRTGTHLTTVKRLWHAVRLAAGLPGLRLHDLRHSYASAAASAGLPLLVIAKMLGHKQLKTTERYSHLADDPVKRAADATAGAIAAAMAAPVPPKLSVAR